MTKEYNSLELLPWYKQMRQDSPVYYSSDKHVWLCFSYAYTLEVLTRHTIFSSKGFIGPDGKPLASGVVLQDPPRHRELRNLINYAFTPGAVANLAPYVTNAIHNLLDHVISTGAMDVIADFAAPLPEIVIVKLLGLPLEDRTLVFQLLKSGGISYIPEEAK